MSLVDRQRIEAVRILKAQGYAFEEGRWKPPGGTTPPALEGDTIYAIMVRRVEEITACDGHEAEFESLTIAINAYESIRWRA
jgi:hypothetical protein